MCLKYTRFGKVQNKTKMYDIFNAKEFEVFTELLTCGGLVPCVTPEFITAVA